MLGRKGRFSTSVSRINTLRRVLLDSSTIMEIIQYLSNINKSKHKAWFIKPIQYRWYKEGNNVNMWLKNRSVVQTDIQFLCTKD